MKRYHLRRKEKEITDSAGMRDIVASARFASVALSSVSGEPYVVTMNHGWDGERDALYFHCAHKGKKIDLIRANGLACATVVEDHGYKHGECDHAYRSVVMYGTIEVVEGLEEKKHGLQVLLDHQEKEPDPIKARTLPDDAAYDKVGVLKMTVEEMTGKQGL
jgi:nitroimidazol reductase NimA-like FMN-containing flavoprotein (pyridoxamine 5'-phosphate oxidase superfamily)